MPVPTTGPTTALAGLLSMERLSLGRAAVGVTMITRPTLLPGVLGVDSATATRMAWSTQMLGAREVALGLGTFVALRKDGGSKGEGRAARLWLLAGLLSDSIDAMAVGGAVLKGRVSKITGAAVVGVAAGASYAQIEALREPAAG